MDRPLFFPGLHQPSDAKNFERCMVSVNVLERRRSDFEVKDWILDSGAFTRITSGKEHIPMEQYATLIERWSHCGKLLAAVSQDYMCESFVLAITGLTVKEHQQMTTSNYAELKSKNSPIHIMPVIQGYAPEEYQEHIEMYGDLLEQNAWVGVGSVCKRNSSIRKVEAVLEGIAKVRPDLKLHGFGLKKTALTSHIVNELLHSCDSMAWSFAARKQGRNANDWREAEAYRKNMNILPVQMNAWPKRKEW